MAYDIDIGGAPASEDCAQLGQTIDFSTANRLEVKAYELAIIARYGPAPAGCSFFALPNVHDFGTYHTLALRVRDQESEVVSDYAAAVEEGLGTWTEAGFSPPVRYDGKVAVIDRPDPDDIIIGALMTTRPNPDGAFPIPDFATLHGNLAAAFPTQADEAARRLATA